MLLRIDHETRLTYTAPVAESVIETWTAPQSQDDQTVLGYRLRVTPTVPVTGFRDGFGNRVSLFNLLSPQTEVVMRTAACVRVHRTPGSDQLGSVAWSAELGNHVDVMEFLRASPQVDFSRNVREFAMAVPLDECGTVLQVGEAIMGAVRTRLSYEKEVTAATTRVSEALELERGVCQDFAHLFLAAARLRGLPARYVSGYVYQPGELATHAWVQVWAGSITGWVNLDPTHGKWVGAEHIVTAVGRDFSDVPPNRGTWKGDATEAITVSVSVQPVERVPADLVETTEAPGWSGSSAGQRGRTQPQNQQTRTKIFRQQQSQQQQTG